MLGLPLKKKGNNKRYLKIIESVALFLCQRIPESNDFRRQGRFPTFHEITGKPSLCVVYGLLRNLLTG